MSKPSKIALFTVIGLCIMALLAYGFLTSRKLDTVKEKEVDSNIDQYLYDEAADTLAGDDDLEDLYDGNTAEDEDDDFEVYEEPGGWEDLPAEAVATDSSTMIAAKTSSESDEEINSDLVEGTPNKEADLEPEPEVSTPEPDPEPAAPEPEPTIPIVNSSNYIVVVGSYSSERNAKKKLKALKEVGFEGSIRQLPGSRLQSVIAGSFPSISAAERQANIIEKKGLRAIVKELD